jgi:hypothetical protein
MTNGKRDYKKENLLYNSKPKQRKNRSIRSVIRVQSNESGRTHKGDGKDIDHIIPLSQGGSAKKSNTRVISASNNRSFPRNADGSIKRKK